MRLLPLVLAIAAVNAESSGFDDWFAEVPCSQDSGCADLTKQIVKKRCGTYPGPAYIEKHTTWATGWRRMASGLSILGRNAGKTVGEAWLEFVSGDYNQKAWYRSASWAIIEYIFVILMIGLFVFLFVLPFLLLGKCCSTMSRKEVDRSTISWPNSVRTVTASLLAAWVLILGATYTHKTYNGLTGLTCAAINFPDQVLFTGLTGTTTWESVSQINNRMRAIDTHIGNQTAPASVPDGLTFVQGRFNHLFADVFYTQGLLKSREYVGWNGGDSTSEGRFKLDLGLAILDDASEVRQNFLTSYKPFMTDLQIIATAAGLEKLSISSYVPDVNAIRGRIDGFTQDVDSFSESLYSNLYDIGTDPATLLWGGCVLTWVVFALLCLLTSPFVASKVYPKLQDSMNRRRAAATFASVLSWFWCLFAFIFCGLGIVFVSVGGIGGGVCDALMDQILAGKMGHFAGATPGSITDNVFRHCLSDTADGKVILNMLEDGGVDLSRLDTIEIPPQIAAVLTAIPDKELTPMFQDTAPQTGWAAWNTNAEKAMILPNAGAELEELKALIGPELAVASYNTLVCSDEPVCSIASARAGVVLERIRGVQDIVQALQTLLTEDAPDLCFDGHECLASPRNRVILGLGNTVGVFPTLKDVNSKKTATPTTELLEGYLLDKQQKQVMYGLVWQGVRLASIGVPLERAPGPVPEATASGEYFQSFSDICPPTFGCSLFVSTVDDGKIKFVDYVTWASTFPATFELEARGHTSYAAILNEMADRLGVFTSVKAYANLVEALDTKYDCLGLMRTVRGAHDDICGGVVADAAALGFQYWGATFVGLAALVCLYKRGTRSTTQVPDDHENAQRMNSLLNFD